MIVFSFWVSLPTGTLAMVARHGYLTTHKFGMIIKVDHAWQRRHQGAVAKTADEPSDITSTIAVVS